MPDLRTVLDRVDEAVSTRNTGQGGECLDQILLALLGGSLLTPCERTLVLSRHPFSTPVFVLQFSWAVGGWE